MGFNDWRRQQTFRISFGKGSDATVLIGDDVASLAFGDDLSGSSPHDLIAEAKRALAKFGDVSADDQLVVIISWSFVAAVGLGHDQKRALALFHVAIRETARATVVGSAYFEPDQIVGIINDAHLVCFGVTHTQHRFVPNAEYIFRSRAGHLSKTFRTVHGKKEMKLRSINCNV